jgi:hypothetical protein
MMKTIPVWGLNCILLGLLAGCAPTPKPAAATPGASRTEAPTATPLTAEIADLEFGATIPHAQSQALAVGSDGTLYLLYGQDKSLFLVRSTDGGQTFSEPVLASGDVPAHVLPVEKPALALDDENRVAVAWLEMPPSFQGATIWYARSEDGGRTFEPGQSVAVEPAGEVAMVQVALDESGDPILAWLAGSKLSFSRSHDGGASFTEAISIGDGSCECCQPQIAVNDDEIHIAYRGLEPGNDKGDIRDIVMIQSADEGATFQPVTRVSDAHWYLPACPIAGPSLAIHNDLLYAAWMDGRLEEPGSFSRGDIWLASSQDDGKTFSPNIRINADSSQHHTLPVLAIGPGGRIHVAWEAQLQSERQAFLYYTFSDDGGGTFALPLTIADNSDPTLGNPGKPAMVVDSTGRVTLTWVDRSGARIASWTSQE